MLGDPAALIIRSYREKQRRTSLSSETFIKDASGEIACLHPTFSLPRSSRPDSHLERKPVFAR